MENKYIATGFATILIGIVFILLVDKPPAYECVAEGANSSGYADEQQDDCPISQESYQTRIDWDKGVKPFRIIGLIAILVGVGLIGYGAKKTKTN